MSFEQGDVMEDEDPPVLGSPEGDGDFESDDLPTTGETSAGGQVSPPESTQEGTEGGHEHTSGMMHVIDEIITGKLQP